MRKQENVRVHLEFRVSGATEVCIAGSFNDWPPSVTPMIPLGNGRWGKELVLPPGKYEYRFVVDGQWMDDPAATQWIPNPFGTANAVLEVVAISPAKAAPAKANEGGADRNLPDSAIWHSADPASGHGKTKRGQGLQ